jgi:hypothetical protein
MAEFLIKREDGRFLELTQAMLGALVTPEFARGEGWGTLRLRHLPTGAIAVISDEMPGLQVWFEGQDIDDGLQRALADGLAARIKAVSGQGVYVIEIG